MPQRIAILYDVTLQTSYRQYQNYVGKYLRLYTDMCILKLMEKIICFMSRSLGTNIFPCGLSRSETECQLHISFSVRI